MHHAFLLQPNIVIVTLFTKNEKYFRFFFVTKIAINNFHFIFPLKFFFLANGHIYMHGHQNEYSEDIFRMSSSSLLWICKWEINFLCVCVCERSTRQPMTWGEFGTEITSFFLLLFSFRRLTMIEDCGLKFLFIFYVCLSNNQSNNDESNEMKLTFLFLLWLFLQENFFAITIFGNIFFPFMFM